MRSLVWVLLAAAAAFGCSSSNAAPHGSPVLLSVYWTAGGHAMPVWSASQTDGGPPAVVPPAGQQVDFVFDRRLDGDKIEDTVTQGGMTSQVPKASPPITVSWANGVNSTPPFSAAQVLYNSEPVYGGSTSYVFLRPATPGFPTNNLIVFTLDKAALTSAYNEPMIGPDQITLMTGPLRATVRTLGAADAASVVPASFMVPIAFTNRVNAAGVTPYVHASSAGGAVPVTVTGDASDPTIVYVTAACAGGWPTAAPVTVTVDGDAPDAFGAPLEASASGTFTAVGASSTDGGCVLSSP
jgi:hypothetical protein